MKVYLSKEPGELHVLVAGVAAFQQSRPAVHVHQALVIVVVNGRTQASNMQLLRACVVHILRQQKRQAYLNYPYNMCITRLNFWTQEMFLELQISILEWFLK